MGGVRETPEHNRFGLVFDLPLPRERQQISEVREFGLSSTSPTSDPDHPRLPCVDPGTPRLRTVSDTKNFHMVCGAVTKDSNRGTEKNSRDTPSLENRGEMSTRPKPNPCD